MSELAPAPELVDPSASPEPEVPAETTTEPTTEGQQVQEKTEEAPAAPTYEVEIDGEKVSVTADELIGWRTDATNMRAMQKASTERYQEGKEFYEKALAIENNPDLKELRNIQEMINSHPETLEEYQRYKQYVQGQTQPVPPGYGYNQPNPVNTQMAYQNTLLQRQISEQAEAKLGADALSAVEKFRGDHPDMTDEQFGVFYQAFQTEVPTDSRQSSDLEYFHYQRFGAVAQKVEVAEAREAGMTEAAEKIAAGKAVGGVTPTGHTSREWSAPIGKDALPGLEHSRRAAMDDPEVVFDGPTFDD